MTAPMSTADLRAEIARMADEIQRSRAAWEKADARAERWKRRAEARQADIDHDEM